MKPRNVTRKLPHDVRKAIWAKHGHKSGVGLNLHSVSERKKVHVKNPILLSHSHPKGTTIVANGKSNRGRDVYQIVHHTPPKSR